MLPPQGAMRLRAEAALAVAGLRFSERWSEATDIALVEMDDVKKSLEQLPSGMPVLGLASQRAEFDPRISDVVFGDSIESELALRVVFLRTRMRKESQHIVALAGAAAHELNQPLTSVMGFAELLVRGLKDQRLLEYATTVHTQALRMARIISDIGKVGKIETKVYVGASQIIDLKRALSEEE